MRVLKDWLLHITVDSGSDDDFDGPFVEISDQGINEADEVRIRSAGKAMRFVDSSCPNATIWSREGIAMLHKACVVYLKAVKEREE